MALVQNFIAQTSLPNQIALNWEAPVNFNTSGEQIVITKTITHFPMELYNSSFPNTPTDPRGIEIFRGETIVGITPSDISVTGNTLTDTSASFPTNPPLNGRLLRDQQGNVFYILTNTSTTVTLSGNPVNGIYVILPDFPANSQIQQNFEVSSLTQTGPGTISNLVQIINGVFTVIQFTPDQLVNLIFIDGSSNYFIVKGNTETTLTFFESTTPIIGNSMAILNSNNNGSPLPYIDNFKNIVEALNRTGSGLLDDTFYYYTAFTIPVGANVAQAEFGLINSGTPTQTSGISTSNIDFGSILYDNYWSDFYQELDTNDDLFYLMQVFGFQLREIHSLINTYNLQDSQSVYVTALLPLSEQFGLPSVGFSIGIDTLRRIAQEMISCWHLKGSKQGIALFIRVITTWDVTGGTGDFSSAISDFLPNTNALRFYDPNLGNFNTKITQTNPLILGGRFVKPLPGIIIPGFFTFREFVVSLPGIALFLGTSQLITIGNGTSTLTDNTTNFGADNSLINNYLLPNQEEINDIYLIISNTATTITVQGTINNLDPGGTYVILSPLNTNRFIILNKLLINMIPFGTQAGFNFVNS